MEIAQDKLSDQQIRDLAACMASRIGALVKDNQIDDPEDIPQILETNEQATNRIKEPWDATIELIRDLKDGNLTTATNQISNVYTHLSEAQKIIASNHIPQQVNPPNYGIDIENPENTNMFSHRQYRLNIDADLDKNTRRVYFIIAALLLIKDHQSEIAH